MLWLKFNTVGALGAGVQAAALWLLMNVFRVHYLIATPIAVEAAILHNFAWHFHWTFNNQRWTFADQGSVRRDFTNVAPPPSGNSGWVRAFCRFQLSAGLISIPENLLMMWLLIEHLQLQPLLANVFSIILCSTANYLLADRFSFRHIPSGS